MLTKRAVLTCFSIALILAAALDAASTVYVCLSVGTWNIEDNPVFRALGGARTGTAGALVVLFGLKAVTATVFILWLGLTLNQVRGLYPEPGSRNGFFRFINFYFCGREVRGWKAFFIVPPIGRLYRGLSVPVAVVVILGEVSASVTNTFAPYDGLRGVVEFWLTVTVVG